MKPKVFVTRMLPDKAIALLDKHCEAEINKEDRVLTKDEIIKGIEGKDALLCLLTDAIDASIMDANPKLKIIANYAVGFNNVDVKAATQRKIPVTNTPGVLDDTTADFAFALLMAVARRIPEADKFTRSGKFKGWGPMMLLGGDISSRTLGIVGAGRIGSAIAYRAHNGFNMKILYDDVVRNEKIEKELNAKKVDLKTLLKESDFVSLHVPLMDKTRHLMGAKELGMMMKTAYLINTSRGPVVDEKALADALKNGKIAGAALDVYEDEPKVNPELMKMNNVILAPHIASASIETRTKMGMIAVENIIAALNGKMPPNIVNKEIYE